jgi:hypothetical protein
MSGSFYIGFERDDGLPGLRQDAAIATSDIDRVAAAYASLYFPEGIVAQAYVPGVPEVPAVPPTDEVLDADGNVVTPANPGSPGVPAVPEVPEVRRPPTGQEVFEAMANGLLQGVLANVINVEKAEAAKAAQDGVPPIVVGG